MIFLFSGTTYTLGQAPRRYGAYNDPAGAVVGVHGAGCTGRMVSITFICMGSAGVLLGAYTMLVSFGLAALDHCAARLNAVPQVRVCHWLALQGINWTISVPARTLESGYTLADAHL